MAAWRTYIDELDKMLGVERAAWEPEIEINDEAASHPIVLLRGPPGSGKSTLGLHILSKQLFHNKERTALFLSLEVHAEAAIAAARQRLPSSLGILLEDKRLSAFSRDDLEKNFPKGDWLTIMPVLRRFLRKQLTEKQPCLVFLDSLNLLAEMTRDHVAQPGENFDMRAAIYQLWNLLREVFPKAAILLTGEHYPSDHAHHHSLMSESFACDIEILLAIEPITGHVITPATETSALGYAIERQARQEGPQCTEMRSFCRVLKSRFTPNESRRCAYDIVSGQGVVFSERFAGDGSIMIFSENAPQLRNWKEFIKHDIPHHFPALRHTIFDRPGQQRTFADQRQRLEFFQKIDADLVCFDSYWVSWYLQLSRRAALNEQLLNSFGAAFSTHPKDWEKKMFPKAMRIWSEQLSILDRDFAHALKHDHDSGEPTRGDVPDWLPTVRSRFLSEQVWNKQTEVQPPALGNSARSQDFDPLWKDLSFGRKSILRPIPRHKLRLYGERDSDLLSELREMRIPSNMSIAEGVPPIKREYWLSVPYNANVSFLVYRKELIKQKREQLKDPRQFDGFRNMVAQLCGGFEEQASIQGTQTGMPPEARQPDYWRDIATLATERLRDQEDATPQTWEEIIAFCEMQPKHHLALETASLDSFLCALLEFIWGAGRDLVITAEYEILQETSTRQGLFRAFYLLCELFERGIIERNSTLEPKIFGSRFPREASEPNNRTDWLFARHWHSSLIEILTEKKGKKGYRWDVTKNPLPVALEIMPLPFSFGAKEQYKQIISQGSVPNRERAQMFHWDPAPVSCWGDWHLALMRGSENDALAISLVNDLMNSLKVYERAISGAALPTVECFYNDYGTLPCISTGERTNLLLSKMTYGQLREQIFKVARTRNRIFDYRHCARDLHSLLAKVQISPGPTKQNLAQEMDAVLKRIKEHRYDSMMIH